MKESIIEIIITLLPILGIPMFFICFFTIGYIISKRAQKRMKDDIIDIVKEIKKKEE